MKKEVKKKNEEFSYKYLIFNSLILFAICYLIILISSLVGDYNYYSVYDKEYLMTFFSMKEHIIFRIKQIFEMVLYQPIYFVPIIYFVSKLKIKKIYRFLITILLTIITSVVGIILALLFL